MVKQLNNVMVPSANLAGSTEFFQEILGLQLRHSGETFSWFKSGTTNIMLVASGDQRAPSSDAGIYLEFVVDDLDALRAELVEKAIAVEKEWTGQNGVRFMSVIEPGGNIVHFVQGN